MDILITRRLTLRPPLDVDAEPITALLQNENVTRNLTNVPHPYALADARDWIERTYAQPGTLNFTIHRTALIGVVGLRAVDGVPDFGYWLGEAFWGEGYMSEAGRAVLAHAFRKYGHDAIGSGAYEDNPVSLRVLEKLGFTPTGDVEPHHCPTRNADVPCRRLELKRADFEKRFGSLETGIAA